MTDSPSTQPPSPSPRDRELLEEARRQVDAARAASPDTAASSELIGNPDALPGYEIIRQLHRGGQGVIFLAIQKSTRRRVAVKVMKDGPFAGAADHARFEREIQILGQLRHPNIVAIHDSGVSGGSHFFVMDYIPGQALDQCALWNSTGNIRDALRLFVDICEAVYAAHSRGIIHRDLKPANIRVDTAGRPHVLDFGLARTGIPASLSPDSPAALTLTGQFMGSLFWTSPEQATGRGSGAGARSDVYSLGVILFQMLTGQFPYSVVGAQNEVIQRILYADPARPSRLRREIDSDVETIILKCLAKQRDRRYADAGDLAADIRRYLTGEPIAARRDSLMYVILTRSRRFLSHRPASRRIAVVVVAALFSTVVGGRVVFQCTSLNSDYERLVSRLASSGEAGLPWQRVALIELRDSTNIRAIAQQESLAGVDPADLVSLRRLHGRLMERLVDSRAACVAWDVFFETPARFDRDFAAGVKALHDANIDVVTAVKTWALEPSGLPRVSPALLRAGVKWGVAWLEPVGLWRLQIAMQARRDDGRPLAGATGRASFALAAFAAACHPLSDVEVQLDPPDHSIEVYCHRPREDIRSADLPVGAPMRLRTTAIVYEIAPGIPGSPHFIAKLALQVPAPAEVARSVHEYGEVLSATPAQRRAWFDGRVIIVADRRRDHDHPAGRDLHEYPGGQQRPGCFAHATAIDQLLSKYAVRMPVPQTNLILAAVSAIAGITLVRRGWRRSAVAGLLLLTIAWIILSVLGYRLSGFLCNPLIPVLAMWLAACGGAWERRIPPAEPA